MRFFSFSHLLLLTLATAFGTFSMAFADQLPDKQAVNQAALHKKLMELEASANGRLGVSIVNTANNERIGYRAEERFPMQSTFKVMVVAAVLKQSMSNAQLLQKKITYTKQDIATWSPVTEKRISEGMTIFELCAAAIMYSDNTAVNLLIKELGGPNEVMAFARFIGDNTYSLERKPEEFPSIPTDINYTSTPQAMEQSLEKIILGDVLGAKQKEQLLHWMKENTTGDLRIRAGVPKGWVVADKTGSGDYGITNDIAVIYPPTCKPIVASIYFIQNKKDATSRPDIIASTTQLIINELSQTDQCIKD